MDTIEIYADEILMFFLKILISSTTTTTKIFNRPSLNLITLI